MDPMDHVATVARELSASVGRRGPLPFSSFMELALYGPGGFYESGRGAGRRRDFLTSPEVGRLYGLVMARHLDEVWDRLGRPDPFLVVEAGAGPGTLARNILGATPACAGALRYLLVERSAGMRALHDEHLSLVGPDQVMGATGERGPDDDEDDGPTHVPGQGPLVASMAHLPAEPFVGVVLANELLDNLAFDLLERTSDGWCEVRVGVDDRGRPAELLVPAEPHVATWAGSLVPDAVVGGRIPRQSAAAAWVADARSLITRGSLIVVDYGVSTTAELARIAPGEWLRTYREHGRGAEPFIDPGTQDITADVALDQLPAATRHRSQADALTAWGLPEIVADARRTWAERAAIGDLQALMARSLVHEADALTDPDGLGAFRILEWDVGMTSA